MRVSGPGNNGPGTDRRSQIPDLSRPVLVQGGRAGAAKRQETYALSRLQADRLTKASPDSLMKREERELWPTTAIPLDTAPLIINQPEDDLDNRFITNSAVPGLRQFIFATYSANILVPGEAKLLLGLTLAGEAHQGHAEIKPETRRRY